MSHISGGDGLNVVGAMRILRLARLARIFRLLRFFKELWLLVAGVLDAMRTLIWAWLLMFLAFEPLRVLRLAQAARSHHGARPPPRRSPQPRLPDGQEEDQRRLHLL